MRLSNTELVNICGGINTGKTGLSVFVLLGGLMTLLVGIIDGYMNPNKCNK